MRSIRDASLLLLALALGACGDKGTEPHAPTGLNGNFGLNSETGSFWVGLMLHESGGVVTGSGWGALMRLQRGITVSGTYQPPAVQLDLVQNRDGVIGHFTGTFERDTLRGTYALEPQVQIPVELTRVDTVPSGGYALSLSGAVSGDFTGDGVFVHFPSVPTGVGLSLDTPGFLYRFGISWDNTNRPAPGVYPLSSGPTPHLFSAFGRELLGFVQFPFTGGTFTLDVSTRWAMIGHFDFTATDPSSGGTVTAHGSFNTGCQGDTC